MCFAVGQPAWVRIPLFSIPHVLTSWLTEEITRKHGAVFFVVVIAVAVVMLCESAGRVDAVGAAACPRSQTWSVTLYVFSQRSCVAGEAVFPVSGLESLEVYALRD